MWGGMIPVPSEMLSPAGAVMRASVSWTEAESREGTWAVLLEINPSLLCPCVSVQISFLICGDHRNEWKMCGGLGNR